MARFLITRRILSSFSPYPSIVFKSYSSFSEAFRSIERENESIAPTLSDNFITTSNHPRRIKLPPLIPSDDKHLEGFSIDLVDHDLWPHTLSGMDRIAEVSGSLNGNEIFDGVSNCNSAVEEFQDLDDIEDLRLHKKLFYKLDGDSKEFEEHNFNFHRTKSSKKGGEKPAQANLKKESKKPLKPTKVVKQKGKASPLQQRERSNNEVGGGLVMEGKRVRTPTFNQLTGPYHLPFCLDIYISKGSVRACIVHRVTSKVVAVAHSISKDLKFDLSSRKDSKACAAVGGVLAQRAIEDDIHNVVYTPRKGDKIEGKLQIVLQSIIDNGIDVKVKLKQKRPVKVEHRLFLCNAEESQYYMRYPN